MSRPDPVDIDPADIEPAEIDLTDLDRFASGVTAEIATDPLTAGLLVELVPAIDGLKV
jgi:hypothetical protein